ncbi:MAG: hypothetical protein JXB30_14255 [Anaerolineae bacterium]|nr:hypothetical protein [Anaerolineae bacterium]
MSKRQIDTRLLIGLIILCGIIMAVLIATNSSNVVDCTSPKPRVDWECVFRPAARDLVLTGNPYQIEDGGFLNAPWALIPLIPLAFLPVNIGYGILTVIGLYCFGYTAYRFGAKPITLAIFLLSPPVLHCLLQGNIDWLVLLGFVLPPQIGLLLVVLKPQMGSVVALFWLVEAFRKEGWREVIRVFWPVTLALGVSFVLYGLWPLSFSRELTHWWNASLWPASIPIGMGLLVASLRKRDIGYAMGASPCLSPYVLLHAWSGSLMAIVRLPYETLAVVVALWGLVLMRGL